MRVCATIKMMGFSSRREHRRGGTGFVGGVLVILISLVMRAPSDARSLDVDAGSDDLGAGTVQPPDVPLPAHLESPVTLAWTEDEIRNIQRELARLGLYRLTVDGVLGRRTEAGLVEAFGDNTWRTMTAADVDTRLKAATPPAGHKGQHALRLGELLADGLLDITLGLGFDESGWHTIEAPAMAQALAARSFVMDNELGIQLYKKAGRTLPDKPFGTFWVRPHALTYKPPAGAARQIDMVVRFVSSPDGKTGAEAARVFKEGMVESDATFYGGHGRYGSGPDFDRNFTVELLDGQGALEQFFDDYVDLEKHLVTEGKPHGRGAWAQFTWRAGNNRIAVHGDNEGNVRLTTTNPHPNEFGARIMYWNLDRAIPAVAPVTGKGGELDQRTTAHPERTYRVVVFDGCRAIDYERSLRATPGMDTFVTDTIASTVSLYWDNIAATTAAFVDAMLGMQSAEDMAKAMDEVQTTTTRAGKGTLKAYGVDDNPVYL